MPTSDAAPAPADAVPADAARADSAPATDPAADTAVETCAACSHALALHDPIGIRYCAASTAGGLTRGCVCVVTATSTMSVSREAGVRIRH